MAAHAAVRRSSAGTTAHARTGAAHAARGSFGIAAFDERSRTIVLVALVAAAVYFFQFNQYGYIMTIPYRSAFTEIADHVYINKTNARDHQEILDLIEQAEERDRSF